MEIILQAAKLTSEHERIISEYEQLLGVIPVVIEVYRLSPDEICRELKISRTSYFTRLREKNWTLTEARLLFAYAIKVEKKRLAAPATAKQKK